MTTQNQKKNKTETTDCDPSTGCCDPEDIVQVGNNVYTNTNGGSGISDHLKELIAKKDKIDKKLKIVQKKG